MTYEERLDYRVRSLTKQVNELEEVNIRQQKEIHYLWDELDETLIRIAHQSYRMNALNMRLRVLGRAHNESVSKLAETPRQHKAGWSRRSAQAKATWAKPRGWKP